MQLLKPQQGKSRLDIENASQEVRAMELDKLIVAKRRELNDLDQLYLNKSSELGQKGVSEEQLWKKRIEDLTIEVEALESRKKSALIPLVEREKEVENRERVLLERKERVSFRESEADSERQMLEDRLDDVSEREQEATKYSVSLNNREFAIAFKEKQVQERMDALTAILIESLEEVKKSQAEAARYKASLKGRDVSITEREKYVEKQEASFSNREKKILDQYRALQKAITETKLNVPTGLHSTTRPRP